jgi:hypothetical protein
VRRLFRAALLAAALTATTAIPALAGSPHFVDDQTTLSQTGNTLTVVGKEAGLGDELQVHLVLSADAACVNPGDNEPQAENKGAVLAEGTFPVQSGKADFILTGTATFQPSCSPPMTVQYSNVVVTDTTNGISVTL